MKFVSIKKISIAAALTALLSGCAGSPSIDPVSLTFTGFSYLLTGKGAMDHAFSAMSGRDCNMVRVAKGEKTCVPRDEDVAGDRMVFRFGESRWTAGDAALVADGDPLKVNPAIAGMVEPLGGSVKVETRSTAIAAVAADTMPLHTVVGTEPGETTTAAPAPDRATRLWLPAE